MQDYSYEVLEPEFDLKVSEKRTDDKKDNGLYSFDTK